MIKKAECQRIHAFKLWCWRRLLRVPWTVRWSNQSILKEINPEYSLEDWCWSSNTLATWCKELTHWKRPWFWERLKAGGEGDARGWDGWMASLTRWTWFWASSRSWWWIGKSGMLQSMESQRAGHDWTTELNTLCPPPLFYLSFNTFIYVCFTNRTVRFRKIDPMSFQAHTVFPTLLFHSTKFVNYLWLSS